MTFDIPKLSRQIEEVDAALRYGPPRRAEIPHLLSHLDAVRQFVSACRENRQEVENALQRVATPIQRYNRGVQMMRELYKLTLSLVVSLLFTGIATAQLYNFPEPNYPSKKITVESTSTPTLNGEYWVTKWIVQDAVAVSLYLGRLGKFPGQARPGEAIVFGWPDSKNKFHTGWNAGQFNSFTYCLIEYLVASRNEPRRAEGGDANAIMPRPFCNIP